MAVLLCRCFWIRIKTDQTGLHSVIKIEREKCQRQLPQLQCYMDSILFYFAIIIYLMSSNKFINRAYRATLIIYSYNQVHHSVIKKQREIVSRNDQWPLTNDSPAPRRVFCIGMWFTMDPIAIFGLVIQLFLLYFLSVEEQQLHI